MTLLTRPHLAPTLEAIARAAEVSIPTASLALNGHARVSARTKARVNAAAVKLGYVPNQAARRLARGRSAALHKKAFDQVGFVLFERSGVTLPGPNLQGPNLAMMLGVERQVTLFGGAMLFLRVDADSDRATLTRLLRGGGADGWLLSGFVDDRAVDLVTSGGAPCVIAGGHACSRPVHTVDVNYASTGGIAVEELASRGHRRIGFSGGSMRHRYQHEILAGFRDAVRRLGLDTDEDLIQTNDPQLSRPPEVRVARFLKLSPRPTAIFVPEVHQAGTLIGLLRARGVEAPGEIEVLGCELDTEHGQTARLARITWPLVEVGRAAASLLRELAGQDEAKPRQVLISPIVERGGVSITDGAATPAPGSDVPTRDKKE